MVKKKKSKPSLQKDIEKLNKTVQKLDKEINIVGKNIDKEVKEVEGWVKERKKFLIKLGWVAGIIIILLVISKLYLRVKGFG